MNYNFNFLTINDNIYEDDLYNIRYWSKEYHVTDIKGFEIINHGYSIEKRSSNFGKMVAGGLLFGGVGALAGALDSGSKIKTVRKDKYEVRLLLNDIKNPMVDFQCQSPNDAHNLIYTLSLLEEKYYKENNGNHTEDSNKSDSQGNNGDNIDYFEQINKIKTLLEQEVITKEEFEVLKKRIINS